MRLWRFDADATIEFDSSALLEAPLLLHSFTRRDKSSFVDTVAQLLRGLGRRIQTAASLREAFLGQRQRQPL